MENNGQAVLQKMLERLMAGLMNGPALNCRPHNSRQRLDLVALERLGDLGAGAIVRQLLSAECKTRVTARVPQPAKQDSMATDADNASAVDDEAARANRAWLDQQAVFTKLRNIIEDAKTYEQDTGVHVLSVGFPVLHLPPGTLSGQSTRRVLAPVAFIPVTITLRRGVTQSIEIACRGSGVDRVAPNTALLAWLEQLTRKHLHGEIFDDKHGDQPWQEIRELSRFIASSLEIPVPAFLAEGTSEQQEQGAPELSISPAPRADGGGTSAEFLPTAVIGLYPMANQGLIDDLKALVAGEPCAGPIESFLRVGLALDESVQEHQEPEQVQRRVRRFSDERMISPADPCQARAVRLAKQCRGLVVHGPPGTGKSQTITNIIGDHLALGQRVLVVCDKRTALDVVYNRLEYLGLGDLCAIVHDPQRDQRDLYRSVRNQLDGLAEAPLKGTAANRLAQIDSELGRIHQELTAYHESLMGSAKGSDLSLHDLMGRWLALHSSGHRLDPELASISYESFRAQVPKLEELTRRALEVDYPSNVWKGRCGASLQQYLERPLDEVRAAMQGVVTAATEADGTADGAIPAFDQGRDVIAQGKARAELGQKLQALLADAPVEVRQRWAGQSKEAIQRARQRLQDSDGLTTWAEAGPLDVELVTTARSAWPSLAVIGQQVAALADYLEIASKWYAFLQGKKKTAARSVLAGYGLTLSVDSASRLKVFLERLRERMLLSSVIGEIAGAEGGPAVLPDDELLSALRSHRAVLDVLYETASRDELRGLLPQVLNVLPDETSCRACCAALAKSQERAEKLQACVKRVQDLGLLRNEAAGELVGQLYEGKCIAEAITPLQQGIDALEDVLRVEDALANLPAQLQKSVTQLIQVAETPEPMAGRTYSKGTQMNSREADTAAARANDQTCNDWAFNHASAPTLAKHLGPYAIAAGLFDQNETIRTDDILVDAAMLKRALEAYLYGDNAVQGFRCYAEEALSPTEFDRYLNIGWHKIIAYWRQELISDQGWNMKDWHFATQDRYPHTEGPLQWSDKEGFDEVDPINPYNERGTFLSHYLINTAPRHRGAVPLVP